jgi:small subunit ribosomal protein S7
MPRGKVYIPKRKILPDPKYKSEKIAKFINYVMREGKKTKAQKIVYQAFERIKEKLKKDPIEVFEKAIENSSPLVEVRPRRIGGANYQIPFPVPEHRRFFLASNWIIEAARNKKGKPMFEKLAEELINAYQNQGEAVKKKEDVHRMAEASKAFAHLAKFTK